MIRLRCQDCLSRGWGRIKFCRCVGPHLSPPCKSSLSSHANSMLPHANSMLPHANSMLSHASALTSSCTYTHTNVLTVIRGACKHSCTDTNAHSAFQGHTPTHRPQRSHQTLSSLDRHTLGLPISKCHLRPPSHAIVYRETSHLVGKNLFCPSRLCKTLSPGP